MSDELQGYPLVTIINSTPYQAKGQVVYPGCRDNDWTVLPWDSWKAPSRGLCLVSYSRYVLIQTSPESFEVTRRVVGEASDQEEPEPTV